jgi:secondary thiamine-phosphate synthase enzyme
MREIRIDTSSRTQLIDITEKVREAITAERTENGICCIFVPHTTAGVTINENADPSVKSDLLTILDQLVPRDLDYSHTEGNSPAHAKSTLVGSSVTLIVENGEPVLGTWQGIFLCEFDGPRRRSIFVDLLKKQ